jgi:hypothetical protein
MMLMTLDSTEKYATEKKSNIRVLLNEKKRGGFIKSYERRK